MKPPQFNLEQVFARVTEAWLAANTVGVPESIKNAAPLGSTMPDQSLGGDSGVTPDGAAPLSGPCIECKQETEDRHDDAWMCDVCAEQLNEEYERDCRLDDPRHKQGGR